MVKIIKVKAKKAFTPTRIPGADYVLNQYIGCEHACNYCYAKFMSKWYGHGAWGSWVVVKENMPSLVKTETVKGSVYMSSVSDPYQPVEEELQITRNVLRNMDKNVKLSILTKSDLVLRDINIFKEFKHIEVGLTINGFDTSVKREIEPFSPSNERRIKALKKLHEQGVKNYAFISPIIPGLVDVQALIEKTKSFTNSYWFEFLNLKAAGKEFRNWLSQNYPESYNLITDKHRFERFVKTVVDAINNSGVIVRGVCVHYPKIQVFK